MCALDPQLVCYSWITGISDVAQVVFVRKRLVEIQYFQTTISDAQCQEFGQLVEDTIRRIESAQFLPHRASAFPKTPARPARTSACASDDRNWQTLPSSGVQETTLAGWMSSTSRFLRMPPKLNRKRALFVLTKIDEILAWEQAKESERDTRFVELGRYLLRSAGRTILGAGEPEVV